MPKLVDYSGRFAFFEEAAFAIVRDHGVDQLSRHRVAKVLGTSISTVRRLLNPHSDLRRLALNETGHRRRAGRYGRPQGDELEVALSVLGRLLPDTQRRIGEELVWWRLVVAAPTPANVTRDSNHPEGPLHHRFAIANLGFVPEDVLQLAIEPPRESTMEDGNVDPVVGARIERDEFVARQIEAVLGEGEVRRTHALLDGLGIGVVLGRLTPEDAVDALRDHLEDQLR